MGNVFGQPLTAREICFMRSVTDVLLGPAFFRLYNILLVFVPLAYPVCITCRYKTVHDCCIKGQGALYLVVPHTC